MPNDEEYENAMKNLDTFGFKADYILTHTAPIDSVEFLSNLRLGVKKLMIEEQPLTGFLKWIESTVQYEKWYF